MQLPRALQTGRFLPRCALQQPAHRDAYPSTESTVSGIRFADTHGVHVSKDLCIDGVAVDIGCDVTKAHSVRSSCWYLENVLEQLKRKTPPSIFLRANMWHLQGMFELWAAGDTLAELKANAASSSTAQALIAPWLSPDVKFKFVIDAFGGKVSQADGVKLMAELVEVVPFRVCSALLRCLLRACRVLVPPGCLAACSTHTCSNVFFAA